MFLIILREKNLKAFVDELATAEKMYQLLTFWQQREKLNMSMYAAVNIYECV